MRSKLSRPLSFGIWLSLLAMTARGEDPRPASSVSTAPVEVCPLPLGSTLPTVTLKTAKGDDFVLAPDRPAKPRVLVFYRGGW